MEIDKKIIQKLLQTLEELKKSIKNKDLSITEFMSALNGYHLKNGKNKTNNPLLKDEMEDLMRKFPD